MQAQASSDRPHSTVDRSTNRVHRPLGVTHLVSHSFTDFAGHVVGLCGARLRGSWIDPDQHSVCGWGFRHVCACGGSLLASGLRLGLRARRGRVLARLRSRREWCWVDDSVLRCANARSFEPVPLDEPGWSTARCGTTERCWDSTGGVLRRCVCDGSTHHPTISSCGETFWCSSYMVLWWAMSRATCGFGGSS